MADDVTLNVMTGGSVVGADEITGVKYQRVKLIHGADGVNNGDVSTTNPLPVKLQSQDTNAEVSTTPLANGASFTTAWFDTQDAPHGFTVAVKSDVAGHTYHEESPNNDGSNIISADDFAYSQAEMVAGVDEEHISHARYSRYRITNDSGSAQTLLIYSVTQRFLDGFGTVKIAAAQNDVTAHGDKEHNTATPSIEAIEALTAIAKAADPTYSEGNAVGLRTTLSGDLAITLAGEAVSISSLPNEGQQTMANSVSVAVASDQAVIPVKLQTSTAGGLSGYSAISTAAVISAAIKASAGQVFGYSFFNNTAAAVFVRLYNMTTAPGTGDTPVRRVMVPANGGVEREIVNGREFTTGIGIRVTGLAPDNDATALTANTVLVNVDYE